MSIEWPPLLGLPELTFVATLVAGFAAVWWVAYLVVLAGRGLWWFAGKVADRVVGEE